MCFYVYCSIFGHEAQDADDVVYINWLSMVRAGLLGLEFYTPESKSWRQVILLLPHSIPGCPPCLLPIVGSYSSLKKLLKIFRSLKLHKVWAQQDSRVCLYRTSRMQSVQGTVFTRWANIQIINNMFPRTGLAQFAVFYMSVSMCMLWVACTVQTVCFRLTCRPASWSCEFCWRPGRVWWA